MNQRIWTAVSVGLLVLGLSLLYVRNSETVQQARIVEDFLQEFCRQAGSYPGIDEFSRRFPDLDPTRQWYYWPNEKRTAASFQYPMTLPLWSAPGRSKLSEFFPVIYAYAVIDPCGRLPPSKASQGS